MSDAEWLKCPMCDSTLEIETVEVTTKFGVVVINFLFCEKCLFSTLFDWKVKNAINNNDKR